MTGFFKKEKAFRLLFFRFFEMMITKCQRGLNDITLKAEAMTGVTGMVAAETEDKQRRRNEEDEEFRYSADRAKRKKQRK